jgi:S1-C subfamily serine protease
MFVRNAVLVTIGALTLLPAAAAAQERIRVRRSDLENQVRGQLEMVTTRRARLGVVVNLQANENDSIGATLESVTPSGPAWKAGLRSGDVITRLDGQSVLGGDTKVEEDQSLPGLRLVELAAKFEPNDTISVEYQRGDSRRTATLVTGNEPMPMGWSFSMSDPDDRVWTMPLPNIDRFRMPEGGRLRSERLPEGGFLFSFGGPLSNVELAPLNADLGSYFGTTEGVLVINVPKESTLGLKGGDVVLSVDGRKTSSPAGLLRILRSYDPGDTFKLEVMRNKSRQTINGTLPKGRNED